MAKQQQVEPPPVVAVLPKWTVESPGFPAKVVEAPDTGAAIKQYGESLGVWHFAVAPTVTEFKG